MRSSAELRLQRNLQLLQESEISIKTNVIFLVQLQNDESADNICRAQRASFFSFY